MLSEDGGSDSYSESESSEARLRRVKIEIDSSRVGRVGGGLVRMGETELQTIRKLGA